MARTIPTPPQPATVIARRRNGAARRIEISAQEVEAAFQLLQFVPTSEAGHLREKLAAVLRPVCNWASAHTMWNSNYPAWGPCEKYVGAPNERCVEHQWPLPAGAQDPFPNRCTATLDRELLDSRWVRYSGGLRCPIARRTQGEWCPHHDPRDTELCGHRADDGSICRVPEGVFACRSHRWGKLATLRDQLEKLPLTSVCGYCDAAPDERCTNKAGRVVAFHKKRVSASEESDQHQQLSDTIEWLSL